MQNNNELLKRDDIENFINSCKKYLKYIEDLDEFKIPEEFMKEIFCILLDLYSKSFLLRDIDTEIEHKDESELDQFSTYTKIKNKIRIILKEKDSYFEAFNPSEGDILPETFQTTISDDLGDIYTDLKRDISKFETGDTDIKLQSINSLYFHFRIHFGSHTIDAIRALHYMIFSHKI